jgi:hypothetical protein
MDDAVFIPVSRGRALTRFALWAVPTAICLAITWTAYPALDYSSTALANRLVTISMAIALLPAPVLAIVCGIKAIRYLLLTFWPGQVGAHAGNKSMVLRLGPFGTKTYDAVRLDIRYPYELSEVEEGTSFEALLPEEKQRERFLPRILHPNAAQPINRLMLHHCTSDEAGLARQLALIIDRWRSQSGGVLSKNRVSTGAAQVKEQERSE